MSTPRQYCGECFALFEAARDLCPHCGAIASRLSSRNYDEKLLSALHHPLADVRLRAVIAIGRRARADLAPALVELALRHPTDVVQGLEIIDSLLRIARRNAAAFAALERLVREHPADVVRNATAKILERSGRIDPSSKSAKRREAS
jgi:predicted amidophosphoribosyltransferase